MFSFFFHNGRFVTLMYEVKHYDSFFKLELIEQ